MLCPQTTYYDNHMAYQTRTETASKLKELKSAREMLLTARLSKKIKVGLVTH